MRFSDSATGREYCREGGDKGTLMMVECPSYFEAYRHVLDGMKEIQNVPFPQYIVSYEGSEKQMPKYMKNCMGRVR